MEKSQDQIKFENLYTSSLGGYCRSYKYKSLGNAIHWIYIYTNLNISEQITVGNDEVHLYGKLLARITWNDELQMPIFSNIDDGPYPYFSENQMRYLRGLKEYPEFIKEMTERYF